VRWSSDGTGEFEVADVACRARHQHLLHLKDAQDYLNAYKLKASSTNIGPYFAAHPDGQGKSGRRQNDQPGEMVVLSRWETVKTEPLRCGRDAKRKTSRRIITTSSTNRSATTARRQPPHLARDGRLEYTQLLFIPNKAPMDMVQP
jgi:molecular chaperone HtpG